MNSEPANNYAEPIRREVEVEMPHPTPRLTTISTAVMTFGAILACLSLALISNRFGNTDTYGLLLVIVAGAVFGFGYTMNRNSTTHAILLGAAFGIASPALLSLCYLIYVIAFVIYKSASG